MDGRLVLLGLIVVIASWSARDLEPARPAAVLARERAVDAVLVEVDRAQLLPPARATRYADTIPSLLFAGGHFMRTALQQRASTSTSTRARRAATAQRITGDGVDVALERRGADLVRLEVGDRPRAAPRARPR